MPPPAEAAWATRDVITDFLAGTDKINLAAIDANGTAAGEGIFALIAAEGAAFSGMDRIDNVLRVHIEPQKRDTGRPCTPASGVASGTGRPYPDRGSGGAGMSAQNNPVAVAGAVFPWIRLTVGAACLAGLIALLFVPQFLPWVLRFEHATADWRTALVSDRLEGSHPRIALVTITPATLRDYANSPVDRGLLARIIKAIDEAGAETIGLDVYFLKPTDPPKDEALVTALRNAKAKIVLGAWDERGQLEEFQKKFQKEFLERIGRPVGYLNLRHQRDDVVRYRAAPHPGSAYPESFVRLLAKTVDRDAPDTDRPIAWLLPPRDGQSTFFSVQAQQIVPGEHATTAASAAGAAAPLKGKVVLIGGDFPDGRDKHRTPLSSWTTESMAGVAIHAQMLADLLNPRRSISELPATVARNLVGVIAVTSFVIGWLLWQTTIVQYIGYTFATAVLVAVDAIAYKEGRLLLPITLILAAWFLGVTGGRAARFFIHWLFRRDASPA